MLKNTDSIAQLSKHENESSLTYVVSVNDFDNSKPLFDLFIAKHKLFTLNINSSKSYTQYTFNMSSSLMYALDTLLKNIGDITSKNYDVYPRMKLYKQTKSELLFYESKKQEYQLMLSKMDSVKSVRFYNHWHEIRDIEDKILFLSEKLNDFNMDSSNTLIVNITLKEELRVSAKRFSFVNMPGVQYNYLIVENPTIGKSYKFYQGATLRYIFTLGKSFFELGAFKALPIEATNKDNLAYDDFFNLAFGQYFYTKHFGRGSRTFLNPHVGYTAGFMMASSSKHTLTIPYLSPSIGVELYKSKNIIFDTKCSYFIPLKENRSLRGVSLSTSINFVF